MKTKLHFCLLCSISIFYALAASAQDCGMHPVMVKIDGKTTTLYRQSYALVIGASSYANCLKSLQGVPDDMPKVKTALFIRNEEPYQNIF